MAFVNIANNKYVLDEFCAFVCDDTSDILALPTNTENNSYYSTVSFGSTAFIFSTKDKYKLTTDNVWTLLDEIEDENQPLDYIATLDEVIDYINIKSKLILDGN